jgi:Ca2+-binding EF-hand superfamily protein
MDNPTLQTLVDSYEDIPAMMHRIRDSNVDKISRFHPAMATNQSVQAEQALRGYSKVDSKTADFARVARMAQQAKKVLNHISSLPTTKSSAPSSPSSRFQNRSISDCAHIAMQKLECLQQSGVDLNRFYSQYDVHKRGRVSYKDFADTMMHLCSGVNKQDLYSVAAAVDAQKTGSVSYDNLLSSLRAVRDTAKYQSLPNNPSSSRTEASLKSTTASVVPVPSPKTVVDVVPLTDALQPCLAAPYDYESGQSKSERRRAAAIQESCFDRIFHPTCPFYLDHQTPMEERGRPAKADGAAVKRARSAPPRAEGSSFYRDHFRHDNLPVASLSELGSYFEPEPASLRTVVTESRERTYASRLGLAPNPDIAAVGSAKSAEQTVATDNKNMKAHGFVWNRVLQESKANIPVLKRLLRQHDQSHSGKLSTEEFRHALQKAGITLTDGEQQQLLVQLGVRANTDGEQGGKKNHRTLQSSSVHSVMASNTTKDGDGNVGIDSFLEALSARASSASFQHALSAGTGKEGGQSVAEREQGRVARKVLEAWQRHSNPAILLQDTLKQTSGASTGPILSETPVVWSQVLQLLQHSQTGLSQHDTRIFQRSLNLTDSATDPAFSAGNANANANANGKATGDERITWGQLEASLKSACLRASVQSQQATSVASYLAKNNPSSSGTSNQQQQQQQHTVRKQQFRYSPTYASSITFHSAPNSPSTFTNTNPATTASSSSSSSTSAGVAQNRAMGDLVDTSLFAATASSKATKKQQMEFAKLQTRLAASSDQLVEAFLHPKYNAKKSTDEWPRDKVGNDGLGSGTTCSENKKTLRRRLNEVGIFLSTEDAQHLERHLQLQQQSSSGAVTLNSTQTGEAALEGFCSALKLPVRSLSNVFQTSENRAKVKYNREVIDPRSVGVTQFGLETPGVFASGTQHSLLATPTYSTTGSLTPARVDRLAHGLLPAFKKRSQSAGRFNSLTDYLAASSAETSHGHTSRFWEMRASVDDVLLFPTQPNSSSSYPKVPAFVHSVHPSKARQGVLSLQEYKQHAPSHVYDASHVAAANAPQHEQQQPQVKRPDSRLSVSSSVSGNSSNNNSVASTVVPRHRPTAAGSHHHLRNHQAHRPTPEYHILTGENDSGGGPESAASTPHYNVLTPYYHNGPNHTFGSNVSTPTAVVSKWAKQSLSSFYEERERVFGGAMANYAKQAESEPGRSVSRGRSRQALKLSNITSGNNNSHNGCTNTMYLTPEPAARSNHKRSHSLPPYATHDGY